MKYKNSLLILIATLLLFGSCKKSYFEKNPPGSASETQINSLAGAELLLIGAYSLLDQVGNTPDGSIFGPGGGLFEAGSGSNWIHGDIQSGDAYKGSVSGDLGFATDIETYATLSNNPALNGKWTALYDGISRSNDVLRAIANAKDADDASVKRVSGQARFLRAHYNFEARKIFEKVPYIDETLVDTRVKNDVDILPKIEADFQFAIDNLSDLQDAVGRANKSAAKAYLAKVLMFQLKYTQAKLILDDVIQNGVTPKGIRYGLDDCFDNNFNADFRNTKESVFALQVSTNDGVSDGDNARWGDALNGPLFGPFCCGFFKPSQNLVNAYKTDAVTGLPLLDTYNNVDLKNDDLVDPSAPFVPTTETVDPRLDFTVGRRGVPWNGFGLMEGTWSRGRDYSGPYIGRKYLMRKSQQGTISTTTGPGWLVPANFPFIRFADVLLWRAEVAADEGDLATALLHVNTVRNRAKNGCVLKLADGVTPAANYKVEPYTAFANKDFAVKAVRFERRLELAMEGQRFYDLVRWGIAGQVLNDYLTNEKVKRNYLNGAQFTVGKDEYLPIPQVQITNSNVNGTPSLVGNRNN
jgi:starch-binding outer membrane protein, SusD/RagB family